MPNKFSKKCYWLLDKDSNAIIKKEVNVCLVFFFSVLLSWMISEIVFFRKSTAFKQFFFKYESLSSYQIIIQI